MSRVYLWVYRSNGGASLVTQGDQWVDLCSAMSGEETGGETNRYDNCHDSGECPWIGDGDTGNLAREKARKPKAGEESNEDACRDQPETVEEHKAQNICLLRAESYANADLVGAQRNSVSHDAEYADDHQDDSDYRESREGHKFKSRSAVKLLQRAFQGT